jgi:NhaP-type Na+/H+ and K+/H+ antiporter
VKKLHLFLFLSVFFLGCGNKNDIYANIQQEQAIVNTQKVRIEGEDKSTLLLTVTYLNNMQKYFGSKTEMIVLSSYYSSFSSEMDSNLKKPAVKINGKDVGIIELDNDNELLQNIPVRNMWSKHYLVLSEKEANNILKLTVEIYPFLPVLLELSKEI